MAVLAVRVAFQDTGPLGWETPQRRPQISGATRSSPHIPGGRPPPGPDDVGVGLWGKESVMIEIKTGR